MGEMCYSIGTSWVLKVSAMYEFVEFCMSAWKREQERNRESKKTRLKVSVCLCVCVSQERLRDRERDSKRIIVCGSVIEKESEKKLY